MCHVHVHLFSSHAPRQQALRILPGRVTKIKLPAVGGKAREHLNYVFAYRGWERCHPPSAAQPT